MGAPSSASSKSVVLSACDDPFFEEKLRQLELRLLAQLEQAFIKSQAREKFLVDTEAGVFLWSLTSGIASGVCVIVLGKVLCAVGGIRRVWKALSDIYGKYYNIGPPAAHEDVCEVAIVLAARGPGAVTEVAPGDVKRREEEMCLRQWVSKAVGETLKWPIKRKQRNKLGTQLLNCDALPIANNCSSQAGSCTVTAPSSVSDQADTVNRQMSVGLYLQNTSLASPKEKERFVAEAQALLPSHAAAWDVTHASTFLSTSVSIAASAVPELLQNCAACLLKLGLSLDSACTVQLGNTVLLYPTQHDIHGVVQKTILLDDEGLHHVPYITSAKANSDRTIVIKGLYLENIGIKATTQSYGESFSLNVIYYQKLEKGLEMLLVRLPKDRPIREGISVHAKKTIQLEGCTNDLALRSNDKKVDIIENKSSQRVAGVLYTKRLWLCFLVLYGYQIVLVSPWQFFRLEWILSLFIWLLCYLLLDYVIGPWTYKSTIRCLELVMRMKHLYHILTSRDLIDKKLLTTGRFEASGVHNEVEDNSSNPTTLYTRQDDSIEDAQGYLKHLGQQRLSSIFSHLKEYDSASTSDTINIAETDVAVDDPNVDDPNWEWPCFERTLRRGRWVVARAAPAKVELQSSLKWPFEVVTTFKPFGKESVRLNVRSSLLTRVLKECQPQTGTHFAEGSSIKPSELFLRLESLKQYIVASAGAEEALSESVWHVRHLVRFVEHHFADTLVQYERMKAEACVSFEMLWAFFVPGERVCRRCVVTNQECFGTVRHFKRVNGQTPHCRVTLNVMDFNVQSYHKCTMLYKIPPFDGEVPFTSLQVCPLSFFPNCKQLEARFVSMGTIFYHLAMQQPYRFMQFKGSMNFHYLEGGCWRLRKLNADGRVMVDLLSFARVNPDYPLGNAEPPCEVMVGMWSTTGQMKQPSAEELMLAPAFVYGFSFRLKRWGCFELCGLWEISFNEGAFDALRMKDESQKMILWSVVQSYVGNGEGQREQTIDPIANKGTGCIVLCHGPPGTGKTLTAEALAERMQCPLWSISAFELGEQPNVVEKRLVQIMEIANEWHAILLLDEADAYLQKREEGVDVQRNLLTGVFLRVLEYHRGIMFLTTNRVMVFDDAILSRITLAISYPALEETQRREIWRKLLLRAGITNVTYDALLHHQLNGRQIRNIVHLAQLLAAGQKQNLHITHVIEAINVSVSCTKDLPAPSS